MKRFAELLDALLYTGARNAKLRLLADYFATTPDPDRGWGLAALTGTIDLPAVKPGLVRDLVMSRVDPVLFAYSYDYVGDLAETVALIWPEHRPAATLPPLSDVVETLRVMDKRAARPLIEQWLTAFDPTARWAFLKLVTGALRVGVSTRLAKTALADASGRPLAEIEEVWHGVTPPYARLFAWLDGRGPRPEPGDRLVFRPLMLAQPIEDADLAKLDPADYRAEWKWDGIRVQLAAGGGTACLFSRTGDDIGAAFPDIVEATAFAAVVDGELLVGTPEDDTDGEAGFAARSFNDLQQRLNRKTVTRRMLAESPAFIRAYDLLAEDGADLRPLPFAERRRRLEAWHARVRPAHIDLSPLLAFATWDDAAALRAQAGGAVEGLMLKRADSAYAAGRPKGPWFKWKRDPFTADCVLMYAQRGHGKRSSFYSDYTFGLWRPGENGGRELVPVGKAYFGFTDEELARLDAWVRRHTTERYGPVRQVEPGLVLEIAFDAAARSSRHKSGVAMRFPRVHRIRWDKPADEADELAHLEELIGSERR